MTTREYCHTISDQYKCPRCLLIDLEKAWIERDQYKVALENICAFVDENASSKEFDLLCQIHELAETSLRPPRTAKSE